MKKWLTIERVNLLIAFDNFFFSFIGTAMKKEGRGKFIEWMEPGKLGKEGRESSRERDVNEGRERMHVCVDMHSHSRARKYLQSQTCRRAVSAK